MTVGEFLRAKDILNQMRELREQLKAAKNMQTTGLMTINGYTFNVPKVFSEGLKKKLVMQINARLDHLQNEFEDL